MRCVCFVVCGLLVIVDCCLVFAVLLFCVLCAVCCDVCMALCVLRVACCLLLGM